jgi:DNA (cytosine-5)-methyltransferase 1
MRILYEFFAGAGMARLGFGLLWQCLFANDIDRKKCASYRRNFGGEHLIEGDIANVTTRDFSGRADCAWMSPPCIGHSEAGNRQGFAEKQSNAFWPAWRRIEELNREGRSPLTAVFENVTGIMQRGGAISEVRGAFEEQGYRHATIIIDAARLAPQSRERVFVIGVREELGVDIAALADKAMKALGARARNINLADILEDHPNVEMFSPAEVQRHLDMLSSSQAAGVAEARGSGRTVAGPFVRRMRGPKSGEREQRVEVRLDGLANALRVLHGGSSRQFIMIIRGAETEMRTFSPREAARLMGLPDSYILPANERDALSLCGDGVCVFVVRFIVAHIIEPALNMACKPKAAE